MTVLRARAIPAGMLAMVLLAATASAGVAWDGIDWNSQRWDSQRWDSQRWDGVDWNSQRWDGVSWDSQRWDSQRWDSQRWDSQRWDSQRWDGVDWNLAAWNGVDWNGVDWNGVDWNGVDWNGGPSPDVVFGFQWGLHAMNVPAAWETTTGERGAIVCVLDTGVDYTHPDLAPNMWTGPDGSHGWDFVNDDADPMDDAGHGTHVAGIAAAAVGNGYGMAGVSNQWIMAVKVMNERGVGGNGNLAKGIRWCADHGADVALMALSADKDTTQIRNAVEYAQSKGVLLVASAGNADCAKRCVSWPAAYDGVLAVGALGMDGEIADFSRTGDYVDVYAPGEKIAGPVPVANYIMGSGTSQAAALVAGLAALAIDATGADAAEVAAAIVAADADAAATLAALT